MINSISNNLITFKGDVNQASQNNIVAKSSSNSQNISKEKKNNKILHIPSARTLGTVFAGLGAILYAAGMGVKIYQYNKISIKSLTAELSKVFRRDLTENETKEIVSRYKELMKIDNAESFTKKAFEQIKKDYGYEKADIPLSIKYKNIWKTLLLHTNPLKKFAGVVLIQ